MLAHKYRVIEYLAIDDQRIITTWVVAGELKQGEHVRRGDSSWGVVRSPTLVEQKQRMYNLTVEDVHTYFVGGGKWLVRNSCEDMLRCTSKADARAGLEDPNLTDAQLQGVRRVGEGQTVEISTTDGCYVIIAVTRPRSYGYQTKPSTVAPDETKNVAQEAYDPDGNLLHYDPITPRRCHVEQAEENTNVVLDVVRGSRPIADLETLGIRMRRIGNVYKIDNPRRIDVQVRMQDVAEGLLRYQGRIGDLRAWATLILVGSDFLDLTDEFETNRKGDALLDALWDLSFEGILEDDTVRLAKQIVEDKMDCTLMTGQ